MNLKRQEKKALVDTIKKLLKKYEEIILYVIVGAITTAVNWVTYSVFVKFILVKAIESDDMRMNVSNVIAWVVAVIFAYFANKIFVFKSPSKNMAEELKKFILFVGSRAITGVLEIVGLPMLVKAGLDQTAFGVDGLPAKIIVSIVVMILNYIFGKLLVFRKKKA